MGADDMKVAIIGAGLAGLSCAHELELHGIYPDIYERNTFIGEQHQHVTAILEVVDRPIKDAVKYFKNRCNLDIKPLNTINSILHYSPNKVTEIKGNLGYFFERGKTEGTVKNQLYSMLRHSNVYLGEYADFQDLSKKYDYVVIASGTSDFTRELGCWYEWINTYVKGAIVLGDFNPNQLVVWLNKDYCKNGYTYLMPFDTKRACIAQVVREVDEREVDRFWELFIDTENIKYKIIEEFKLNHKSGYVYPHKVGNIYLAGDAGGVIEPFLGFGQLAAITMGVLAARSIAKGKDYEKLVKPIVKHNLRLHEFRKVFNMCNNTSYDVLVSALNLPVLKHLIYYTPINVVRIGSMLAKMVPKQKITEK